MGFLATDRQINLARYEKRVLFNIPFIQKTSPSLLIKRPYQRLPQSIIRYYSVAAQPRDYVIMRGRIGRGPIRFYDFIQKSIKSFLTQKVSVTNFFIKKIKENKKKIIDFLKDNEKTTLATLSYLAALYIQKFQENEMVRSFLEAWLKMSESSKMKILEKVIDLITLYEEDHLTDIEKFKDLLGQDAIIALKDQTWDNLQKKIIKNIKEFILNADLDKENFLPVINILFEQLAIKSAEFILEDRAVSSEDSKKLTLDLIDILNHFYKNLTLEGFFQILEDPNIGHYLESIEKAPNKVYKIYYITEAIKSIPSLNVILDDPDLFMKIDKLNQSIDKLTDNYTTIDWIFDNLLGHSGKNKAVKTINYCMNQLGFYLGATYIKPLVYSQTSNSTNSQEQSLQKRGPKF